MNRIPNIGWGALCFSWKKENKATGAAAIHEPKKLDSEKYWWIWRTITGDPVWIRQFVFRYEVTYLLIQNNILLDNIKLYADANK